MAETTALAPACAGYLLYSTARVLPTSHNMPLKDYKY